MEWIEVLANICDCFIVEDIRGISSYNTEPVNDEYSMNLPSTVMLLVIFFNLSIIIGS